MNGDEEIKKQNTYITSVVSMPETDSDEVSESLISEYQEKVEELVDL